MANVSRRTRNIRLKQTTYHLNWELFIGKQGLITLKKLLRAKIYTFRVNSTQKPI
jgi:hypothetical protein